ncbi:MAG: TetR/AcrR family transcriptional regulator [Actinomycetota bacterium]|nr:TetR/AcrR family transcriptional regulator [Actinomycetota bacterium]
MSDTRTRREQIVIESRRIVEREGLDALTMRSLADAMGIKAPSLYKHVRDREEIELLLTEVAFEEMGEALGAAGPDLGDIGRAYRAWATANPGLYRIATGGPLNRERLSEGAEARAAAPLLKAVGNDRDLARACWSMAHGLVDLELSGRFPPDADIEAAWNVGFEAFRR